MANCTQSTPTCSSPPLVATKSGGAERFEPAVARSYGRRPCATSQSEQNLSKCNCSRSGTASAAGVTSNSMGVSLAINKTRSSDPALVPINPYSGGGCHGPPGGTRCRPSIPPRVASARRRSSRRPALAEGAVQHSPLVEAIDCRLASGRPATLGRHRSWENATRQARASLDEVALAPHPGRNRPSYLSRQSRDHSRRYVALAGGRPACVEALRSSLFACSPPS